MTGTGQTDKDREDRGHKKIDRGSINITSHTVSPVFDTHALLAKVAATQAEVRGVQFHELCVENVSHHILTEWGELLTFETRSAPSDTLGFCNLIGCNMWTTKKS